MNLLIGFVIGYLLSGIVLFRTMTSDNIWHKQAIEHHAARHNPTTGDFEWLDTLGGGK